MCIVLSLLNSAVLAATAPMTLALSPQLSVAGQMSTDKFKKLMEYGFQSVIVNQPDQETGNTVRVEQLRNIAEQSNVSVIYQPIPRHAIAEKDVIEFAKYYQELPKPILMICKSGERSKQLFYQAQHLGLLHE